MGLMYFLAGTIATTLAMPTVSYAALPTQSPVEATKDPSGIRSEIQVAGLFRVLDVAEDIDDLAKGNIGGIDPIKEVTRDVEDAFDDTRDEIDDFGDDVGDGVRDVNKAIDRAADDVNDWFD
jgi:hypothetical protein